MNAIHPCFCGSNTNFSSCCQPYIDKKIPIQTAEQLMRSRFSAYAIGNAQYIFDTYAKSSQLAQSVKDIDDWSNSCVWIALKIYPMTTKADKETEQFVEFSAFYIINNTLCELREESRFILEDCIEDKKNTSIAEENNINEVPAINIPLKQWRYIDGDIISNIELASIKRNELCPCNHYPTAWQIKKGKKFKHCCGK